MDRRQLLKSLGALSAASAGSNFWPHTGLAQGSNKEPVLLWVFLNGGYAPMQTSAQSFIGNSESERFGCTAENIAVRGDISYDTSTFGQLPAVALDRLACIGTTGASNHNSGKHFWSEGGVPTPLQIASAMQSPAAIKAAKVGDVTGAPGGSVGGVSLEAVNDLAAAKEALTGEGQIIPKEDRPLVAEVLKSTKAGSEELLTTNPYGLGSLVDGYNTLIASMSGSTKEVNIDEITTAYQTTGTAITSDFKSKMAAAEYLFRSGVKVVCVGHGNGTYWDTHDDNSGTRQRQYFSEMVPGLSMFAGRMLGTDQFSTTIVFVSEHSRIPKISNHGPDLSSIVISDNAVGGASTGQTNNVGIIPNAPGPKAYKACIAELCGLKGSKNPFGANPHTKIVKS